MFNRKDDQAYDQAFAYVKRSKNREQLCIERYDLYQDRFYDFMSSDEGAELIRIFDHQYPNNGISNVKKIDFIMWQDR